jgi:hypothetical protein
MGALLFRALDFFPIRPDLVHVFDLGFAKNMRMAADQFVHQMRVTFSKSNAPRSRQLAMKNHLQQQIAQFLGHFVIVARLDGVNQFINLLDRVAPQGRAFARDPTDSPSANAASP